MIRTVIATAGRRTLLARTLESLSQCDVPEGYKETIVVENGPRVGVEDVVASCAPHLRARYLYVERASKSNALNMALEKIDEDCLVLFSDDDIRFDKGHLVVYASAAGGHPDAFFGGFTGVDYEGDPPPDWLLGYLPRSARGWTKPHREPLRFDWLLGYLPRSVRGWMKRNRKPLLFLGFNWAMYVRDWNEAGGFDLKLGPGGTAACTGMEMDMQRRLYGLGRRSVFIEDALVWHYVPDDRCSPEWTLERAYKDGVRRGHSDRELYFAPFGVPLLPLGKLVLGSLQLTYSRVRGEERTRFWGNYRYLKVRGLWDGLAQTRSKETR